MGQERGTAWRAFAPALAGLALAFAATWIPEGWRPEDGPGTNLWPWLPAGLALWAAGHGLWVGRQLRQAGRGRGLRCACGGPLTRERGDGAAAHRRCRCCGRRVARRFYLYVE